MRSTTSKTRALCAARAPGLILLVTAGCGGGDAEQARPAEQAARPAGSACGEQSAQAVTLSRQDGIDLDAFLLGDGELGVVLGHQLGSNYCSWLSFAKKLAERHVSVLAINFVSVSPEDDMAAGARGLQTRGADRVKLAGASMGGTAALVAAQEVDAAGVASLSGPESSAGSTRCPRFAASKSQRSSSLLERTPLSFTTHALSSARRGLEIRPWS